MIVYLVGMPGSGKSVVGEELAGRLGVPFIDLDTEIERETGSTVAQVFESEGESAFRALEAAALVKASMQDPAVVSCGGGVVLEQANRITLRATWCPTEGWPTRGSLRSRPHSRGEGSPRSC